MSASLTSDVDILLTEELYFRRNMEVSAKTSSAVPHRPIPDCLFWCLKVGSTDVWVLITLHLLARQMI